MGFELTTAIPWRKEPAPFVGLGVTYDFAVPGETNTPHTGQQSAGITYTGSFYDAKFRQDNITVCADTDYEFAVVSTLQVENVTKLIITQWAKAGSDFVKTDCYIQYYVGLPDVGVEGEYFRDLGTQTAGTSWTQHTASFTSPVDGSWILKVELLCAYPGMPPVPPTGSFFWDDFSIEKSFL